MIAIVDLDLGNTGSIRNMLKRIGTQSIITADEIEISNAEKIILPGVGAFDYGIKKLEESGLSRVLNRKALEEGTPFLAICLGMQLLTEKSEEGQLPGLGWIQARTVRFRPPDGEMKYKIPHIGWNSIRTVRPSRLFEGLEDNARFYFVHSYHLVCQDNKNVLTETTYGCVFTSAVARGNIMAVQFHPEKSHKCGMKLLKNFAERC